MKKEMQDFMSRKLKFFMPDWSDLVNRDYNYVAEEPLSDVKVYSHEIYDHANFDGLLVSKIKLEQSGKNLEAIMNNGGIHQYLRYNGPVFGDNGAYSYIDEKTPPFTVPDLLNYYDRLGVDLGVSLDHIVTPKYEDDKHLRKDITIEAAGKFMDRHQDKGYEFVPIGSAQGWNKASYYESVEALIDANYKYIAIGGVSSATTKTIVGILKHLHPLIKDPDLDVHLFGVARIKSVRTFMEYGVTSLDSASMIRTAFKGWRKNYFDSSYQPYTAIRLPFASRVRSADFKALVSLGLTDAAHLGDWEADLYKMLFDYDKYGLYSAEEVTEALALFESAYIRTYENKRIDGYLKTLKEKPWKDCPCRICKEIGIEVLIFRGNNRNRRRGFHNAYVFYHLLQKVLDDPDFDVDAVDDDDDDDADLPSAGAFSDRFVEIADDVDDTEQLTLDDFF